MIFQPKLFRKVTIVGVGLIGGSVGMAIKKYDLAKEVVGISQRNSSTVYAAKSKAIDRAESDLKRAVSGADLVLLAAPVNSIMKLLRDIGPHIKRNCIISDVGSTKTSIVHAAEKQLPNPSFFIGAHPLAGSEKHGASYANADLFQEATCILTPTKTTNRMARDKMKQFWTKLGARVKIMSPENHDEVLSFISHMPHLVAYAMMGAIPKQYLEYATQGLRDSTRVAASSPQLWNDISMANQKNIIKALDDVVNHLSEIRKSITAHDEQQLINVLDESKKKRDNIEKV